MKPVLSNFGVCRDQFGGLARVWIPGDDGLDGWDGLGFFAFWTSNLGGCQCTCSIHFKEPWHRKTFSPLHAIWFFFFFEIQNLWPCSLWWTSVWFLFVHNLKQSYSICFSCLASLLLLVRNAGSVHFTTSSTPTQLCLTLFPKMLVPWSYWRWPCSGKLQLLWSQWLPWG